MTVDGVVSIAVWNIDYDGNDDGIDDGNDDGNDDGDDTEADHSSAF